MRPLTTPELMAAWDHAVALPPWSRPLAILAAGCRERDREELAQLSVGQRDVLLLALREWALGPEVVGVADCPACGESVELTFLVQDIRVPAAPAPELLTVHAEDYELKVRVPTGADLECAAQQSDEADAVAVLMERCVLSARRGTDELRAGDLPGDVLTVVDARMAEADPQADVELSVTCSACGHGWPAPFDIGTFFWAEIDAWAARVLHDVHRLALAYGWREPDVLALSPRRRQHYLAMVGA